MNIQLPKDVFSKRKVIWFEQGFMSNPFGWSLVKNSFISVMKTLMKSQKLVMIIMMT